MNTAAFDTLAFSKRLQEAGVPVAQAEAHAIAQADFLTHHLLGEVATKDDLKVLQTATEDDFKALRAAQTAIKDDFQALRVEMKAGLAELEAKLVTLQLALKAGLAELETKLTMRMLLMVALLATLMTVFKFIG